jgi:hypothetical protein
VPAKITKLVGQKDSVIFKSNQLTDFCWHAKWSMNRRGLNRQKVFIKHHRIPKISFKKTQITKKSKSFTVFYDFFMVFYEFLGNFSDSLNYFQAPTMNQILFVNVEFHHFV